MCYRKKQSLTEPTSLCPADDVLQTRLSEGVECQDVLQEEAVADRAHVPVPC